MMLDKRINKLKRRCNKLKKRQLNSMDDLLFNKNVSAKNKQIILDNFYRR